MNEVDRLRTIDRLRTRVVRLSRWRDRIILATAAVAVVAILFAIANNTAPTVRPAGNRATTTTAAPSTVSTPSGVTVAPRVTVAPPVVVIVPGSTSTATTPTTKAPASTPTTKAPASTPTTKAPASTPTTKPCLVGLLGLVCIR